MNIKTRNYLTPIICKDQNLSEMECEENVHNHYFLKVVLRKCHKNATFIILMYPLPWKP